MLSTYLYLFTFCVLSIIWLRRVTKNNKRLPPGPVGIPLLGYLPFMDVFHTTELGFDHFRVPFYHLGIFRRVKPMH